MTSPPVVCNASPLIALEQIAHLPILKALFGTVLAPPAVVEEVAPDFVLPEWIEARPLVQGIGPLVLGASLGPGESEAISLALEVRARLIVLDDRPARRLAQALKLPVIGTLGILLAGKRQGLLRELKPCLNGLLAHDFRVAPSLYAQVLRDAGEGG